MDGIVVVNQIIDIAKRRKDQRLLFKINFEKAYDCVEWEYLGIRFQWGWIFTFFSLPMIQFNWEKAQRKTGGDSKTILRSFELVSGLRINFFKSKLLESQLVQTQEGVKLGGRWQKTWKRDQYHVGVDNCQQVGE